MMTPAPWTAEIIGPVFEPWRYEINLKQKYLMTVPGTEPSWWSFEEEGIYTAWTKGGAERKARRLVARRNRRDQAQIQHIAEVDHVRRAAEKIGRIVA